MAGNRARRPLAAALLFAALCVGIAGLLSPPATSAAQSALSPDGLKGLTLPLLSSAALYDPLKALVNPVFGANVRANTDTQSPNLAQQEPSIEVNPLNPLNVVAAAKDERAGSNTKQIWIYTSTDGGQTWLNQIFPLRAPLSPLSSDPVVKFSDDGICYVTALPYNGGAAGIQVAASTDGGLTFLPATQVTTNGNADKEWMWVDNFPASSFYHRMYVAWMDFTPGFRVTYSTDRGQTWTTSALSQPANQFPMPIVYPNGVVSVIYYTGSAVANIRSTNGGVNWTGAQSLVAVTSPRCPPDNSNCGIWRLSPVPVIAVNPNNGNAVVMWADGTGGTATIRYITGTANGTVWSASQVLAPPGVGNTYQIEPWVDVDEQGTFHAIWYDDRANPNTSLFHIYYSQSTDDGQTWSPAVRISTASTDLRIGIPSSYAGAAGDYINASASHGNLYAAWTDTRAGNGEDIYVVRGTYGAATSTPTATAVPPTQTPTLTPSPTLTPTSTSSATPTDTPSPTATGTPVPRVILTGHVLLQGRPAPPDPHWSVPVTLTLRSSTGAYYDYAATTGSSGYFTITAPAPDTYTWRVKNPQTLANSGTTELSGSQVSKLAGYNLQTFEPSNLLTIVEMGTLAEGDATDDNCVNSADFTILRNTFGKSVGDPGYDARADFNGDDTVNSGDFNLLKATFGICGAGPLNPLANRARH